MGMVSWFKPCIMVISLGIPVMASQPACSTQVMGKAQTDMIGRASRSVVHLWIQSGKDTTSILDSLVIEDNMASKLDGRYGSEWFSDREIDRCSGVILNDRGMVVTNDHCIPDGDINSIRVVTADRRIFRARMISTDSTIDLAFIRIINPDTSLIPMKIRKSPPRLGEEVFTIGNPLNYVNSVSRGIVSGLNRRLGRRTFEDLIQTDGAVNPGNSGGALVDADGKLLGVVNSMIQGAQSIGFAIPARTVSRAAELMGYDGGKLVRSYMGIMHRPLRIKESMQGCHGNKMGIIVAAVDPKGPSAGVLKPGDIILSMDQDEILDGNTMRMMSLYKGPGIPINLKVLRGCRERSLRVIPRVLR